MLLVGDPVVRTRDFLLTLALLIVFSFFVGGFFYLGFEAVVMLWFMNLFIARSSQ